MKSVAITGSFASGKSFVLKYIERMGYKVFSCDDYVRKLYLDQNIQQDLLSIIDNIGEVFDKTQLIKVVFSNNNQRKKLEQYIHPKVMIEVRNFKNKYINEKVIFIEVPLLFEAELSRFFDYSACVYCDEKIREKRARERNNFDLEIYNKLRKIQLPPEEKRKLADFQINTDKNIEIQINYIINSISKQSF